MWCGAGGDDGSAATFVAPAAPAVMEAPAAPVAELAAAPQSAGEPIGAAPPMPQASFMAAGGGLQGIGGWLILVALGLGLEPLSMLGGIGASSLLLVGPTSQSFLAAHPGIGGQLVIEAVIDVCLFAVLLVLNYLFYGKKKIFPMWMICYLVGSFLLHFLDEQMMMRYTRSFSTMGVFTSFVSAAIWIPYFVRSERVKQTFVN